MILMLKIMAELRIAFSNAAIVVWVALKDLLDLLILMPIF